MRYLATHSILALLLASSLLLGQATTEKPRSPVPAGINDGFLAPDLDAEEWLGRFEVESREVFANREQIVAAIGLKPGDRIADVGAGTGLFVNLFSAAVQKAGRVYAVDISPKLVEFVNRRVAQEGWENVKTILSQEDSAKLPNESVDVVFICDTYHHFEYHADMLLSILQALRSGGQLILIEFDRIPGKSREWLLGHVRAGKAEFQQEIVRSGFRFKEEVEIPGFAENYFLRFEKP